MLGEMRDDKCCADKECLKIASSDKIFPGTRGFGQNKLNDLFVYIRDDHLIEFLVKFVCDSCWFFYV